jgi:hypothetical protein
MYSEDECGDEESKKDSNNMITDLFEICIGRGDADDSGRLRIVDTVTAALSPGFIALSWYF